MKLNDLVIIGVAATTVVSCAPSKKEYTSYELYPVRTGSLTEMKYSPDATQFTLWSPTAGMLMKQCPCRRLKTVRGRLR